MLQWQFIDLNMFRANFCPSSGAQDWDFFYSSFIIIIIIIIIIHFGRYRIVIFRAFETGVSIFFLVLSRVCAFWVCKIFWFYSSFLRTVHVVPRCRAPNPCLPQQQDTTPYVVKKKHQSCAPEDGQKFAQNMLSWSWRSMKLLLLHLVGFHITLYNVLYYYQCCTCFRRLELLEQF